MKTLDLFIEPPNCPVRFQAAPNDDVLTYVLLIRCWTAAGAVPGGVYHSNQLEAGVATTLGADLGYDFILKAAVRPGGQAAIKLDLEFGPPGAGGYHKPVTLPNSEGPVVERSWKVIVR